MMLWNVMMWHAPQSVGVDGSVAAEEEPVTTGRTGSAMPPPPAAGRTGSAMPSLEDVEPVGLWEDVPPAKRTKTNPKDNHH